MDDDGTVGKTISARSRVAFDPARDFLALDFDGVIVDSITECLVASANAWSGSGGDGNRVLSPDAISAVKRREFRRLRCFARYSEDFVYIQQALAEGRRPADQADFDAFTEQYRQRRDEYRERFYRERDYLMNSYRKRWLELNPFYPGMADWLRHYPCLGRLAIISTKQARYIRQILTASGIDLPAETINEATFRLGKTVIIEALMQRRQLACGQVYFIDDQLDNLVAARPTGVHLLLAGWGYNNRAQQRLARQLGARVLSMAQFRALAAM